MTLNILEHIASNQGGTELAWAAWLPGQ